MAVAYKEKAKTHTRRRKHGFLKLLLTLLVLCVAAAGAWKLTDGFRELHLPVKTDMTNVEADITVDYAALASRLSGEDAAFEASEDDLAALRDRARDYPEHAEAIEFFIDHIGAYSQLYVNTILLSPEKAEFALLAPFWQEQGGVDGARATVTAGKIPYFIQYDTRWAFSGYGSSCAGNTACGPTCLAMAAAGLTGDGKYTPDYLSAFAEEQGYYVDGVGTAWDLFTDGAEELGLAASELSGGERPVLEALRDGGVVVASMLPGDFTMAGHFIVLYGWGLGGFRVYDPSSIERSGESWTWSKLSEQIAQCWAIHA